MVSFVWYDKRNTILQLIFSDTCQETLKKAKLDAHKMRCKQAQFSCIDCSKTFSGADYRAHTTCISEEEKYQKSLFKPKVSFETDVGLSSDIRVEGTAESGKRE